MKIGTLLFALAVTSISGAAAQEPVWPGYWDGVIQISPAESEVDVLVELSRDAAGALRGRLWYPTHPEGPFPLEHLAVHGRDIAFDVHDKDNVVSYFSGAVRAGEPVIEGTFRERQVSYPFALHWRSSPPAITVQVGELSDDASELRSEFEGEDGHVRIVLILSPMSFQSKIALRVLKRYVLDEIADPALRVYVVWEPPLVPRAKTLTALAIKPLVTDPRVAEYLSKSQAASKFLQTVLAPESAGKYSLCLVFSPHKSWTHGPQAPDLVRLGVSHDPAVFISKEERWNGPDLAARIKMLLAPAAALERAP
jgi:hypothetical protein